MLDSLLYILVLLAVLAPRRQQQGQTEALAALLKCLQGGLAALDGQQTQEAEASKQAVRMVAHFMKTALFQGRDSSLASAEIQLAVSHALIFARAKQQVLSLMRMRWLGCLMLAQLGRLWLLGLTSVRASATGPDLRLADASLAVLSLGLVWLADQLLRSHLPEDWFWKKNGFSDEALEWLRLLFGGFPSADRPLSKRWRQLHLQECYSGRDQSASKLLCLTLWAREQRQEQVFSQRKFEDVMPLFELLALGLPTIMLLVVPGLPLVVPS